MTVVRLSNGDLFLHSPTKFEPRWRTRGDPAAVEAAAQTPFCRELAQLTQQFVDHGGEPAPLTCQD